MFCETESRRGRNQPISFIGGVLKKRTSLKANKEELSDEGSREKGREGKINIKAPREGDTKSWVGC